MSKCMEDFDLVSAIGVGAYGEVFLAKDKATHAYVAIKIQDKLQAKQHKENERRIAGLLSGPRSSEFHVALLCAFQTETQLCLVAKYCAGGDLGKQLKRHGKFSYAWMGFYVADIAYALKHLHAYGIVHRDVRPEHILIDERGRAVLTDFGTALELNAKHDWEAMDSCVAGSHPGYAAPELRHNRSYSFAVDWYALGAIAYQMLTGALPLDSTDGLAHIELPSSVDVNARRLIEELLASEPEQRLDFKGVQAHEFYKHSDICWASHEDHRTTFGPLRPDAELLEPEPEPLPCLIIAQNAEDFFNSQIVYENYEFPVLPPTAPAAGNRTVRTTPLKLNYTHAFIFFGFLALLHYIAVRIGLVNEL